MNWVRKMYPDPCSVLATIQRDNWVRYKLIVAHPIGLGRISGSSTMIQRPFPVINSKESGAMETPIKIVACGAYFAIIVTEDDKIFGVGECNYSQLGTDKLPYTAQLIPIDLTTSRSSLEVLDVKCGHSFTYFITNFKGKPTLWGCGRNIDGQLSLKACVSVPKPTIIDCMTGKKIKHFACGYGHAIAVTTDEKIYTCGDNRYSQCGTATSNSRIEHFTHLDLTDKIEGFEITSVCCGYYHTVVCVDNSRVYAFGANRNDQFGNNSDPAGGLCTQIFYHPGQEILKVGSGARYIIIVTTDGQIWIAGSNMMFENTATVFTRITQIESFINSRSSVTKLTGLACGFSHCIFVTEEQRVFVRGENEYGQLGIPGLKRTGIDEIPLHEYKLMTSTKSRIRCCSAGDHFNFFAVYNGDGSFRFKLFNTLQREDHGLADISIKHK